MSNQECKARTKIIDVNNNEYVFYPYSIKVNKCSVSCNKNQKCQESMKQDTQCGMELVNAYVD